MQAEVMRLASAAMGQFFSWGPQEHRSTYERIIAAAMRYSAVVNYAGAVEIPLLPRHPASSSSSASTAASQPTPATFVKDRLGDQRGGSEWEPIKILLEGD
jgi:hypothetical protein